jgi:hypothetical protein
MKSNNNHISKLPSNHIPKPRCDSEESGSGEKEVPSVERGGGGDRRRSNGVESGGEETDEDFIGRLLFISQMTRGRLLFIGSKIS